MEEKTTIQQTQDAEIVEAVQDTEEEAVQTPDADTVEPDAVLEAVEQAEEPKKRRGGRKPMTPEEKEARRRAREEAKMNAAENAQEPGKRRGGRKPYTAAQRAAAAKAREEVIQKAANLTPEVHVQYQDSDAEMQAIIAAAKEDFRSVKKRMRITDMKLYVKPEERTAYYVINGDFSGKVTY